jgi:hypothetical protein
MVKVSIRLMFPSPSRSSSLPVIGWGAQSRSMGRKPTSLRRMFTLLQISTVSSSSHLEVGSIGV